MRHSLLSYGYGEIVLQFVLLLLAILFFVFICLFLLNSVIKGVKRNKNFEGIRRQDQSKDRKEKG
ncbi:hypothetical protein [Gottfriedia acidiceleris]|uniref:hypothetical protein n=1 Tax=Gottfriedia acidiceleris TaxID=371036 RepID=UPI000B437DBD|nr:hypothetical protein [Gottfriedia acidiceleris]